MAIADATAPVELDRLGLTKTFGAPALSMILLMLLMLAGRDGGRDMEPSAAISGSARDVEP